MSWTAIGVLAAGAFGLKALGVFGLARLGSTATAADPLLRWFPLIAGLLPAALFSALVAVQTLAVEDALRLDARVAGVAVAGVAVWRRLPFVAVVVAAMTVTAAVRWQTWVG